MPYNDCLFNDNVQRLSNSDSHAFIQAAKKMKPSVDVEILTAKKGDEERILRFLQKYFFPHEPTSSCLNRLPKTVEECPGVHYLDNGYSLIAINKLEKSEDNIIGVILNKEQTLSDYEKLDELIQKNESTTHGEILKILKKLEEGCKMWDRIQVDKVFYINILSVKTDYRGLHIGKKLVEKSIEMAKLLNYQFIAIECSSYYSAKLVAELGFEQLHEIPYKDYLDKNGRAVFQPELPHVALKKFIKSI